MKLYQSLFLLMGGAFTGCAVTSGLQTYDLQNEGMYTTELGSSVNVIKLTQEVLPALTPAERNISSEYSSLFHNKHQAYTLSNGDVLSIQLWANPELSSDTDKNYQVDSFGYINLPMIGRYKASGKTVHTINQELAKLFSRYLKNPDVLVRIINYQGKKFSVTGNVNRSGEFSLNDQPTSLYTALSLAGGITPQVGDSSSIILIRNGKKYQLNNFELEKAGYSLHGLFIQPNDSIYVNAKENQKIYVMGEAGKNQSLHLRDQGMTLGDVLGESGGLNPLSASRSKIYVVRTHPTDGTTEVYHLDLTSIGDFGLANQFTMRSNDIVYIDASGLARWQRVLNQIMPFSNALYNLDRLGQ